MIRRVQREATGAGIDTSGTATVEAAVTLALEYRLSRVDHDSPDLLHPARTVLILLGQAGERDPVLLAAAALVDSAFPALVPDRAGTLATPLDMAEGVPTPSRCGAALTEALLFADRPGFRIAVAERLDHARHLHLRDPRAWRPMFRSVTDIYLPLAERRRELPLGVYLRRWADRFERRWLGRLAQ